MAGRSTYYVELEGLLGTNRWAAYDVATGRQLFNTTVDANLRLQLPMYIPPKSL